jgi:TolB protein
VKRPLVLIATLLVLVACQPGETGTIAPTLAPTATPIPPTGTPVPPTPSVTLLLLTATPIPPTPTVAPLPPLSGSGGGRIAFSSRRGEGDYEVYAMNADGTDQRQLTRDAYESEESVWSPDGSRIVFVLDSYRGSSDLYVINADGSNKQRLTKEGNAGHAAWSPDGTHVAFSRYVTGGGPVRGSTLYLMAVPDGTGAVGRGEQRLTQTGTARVSSPSWSPDGTHIVCVVSVGPDLGGESTLYVLDVQAALQSGGASLADMRALPQASQNINDRPAWSPTGALIAFSAAVGSHRDIYIINADGTDLRQLTQTPDLDEHAPAWSPDGAQIVFQANPDAQWDIYVMNADGSGRRRLTIDIANDTTPSWAP